MYVEDVDTALAQASAQTDGPAAELAVDPTRGDRCGSLTDSVGIVWRVASHVEDVSDPQLAKTP
jgi:uncharacterized glyoxalase superfamily protein PhnB